MTRRNSHPRAPISQLYSETGAVLLSNDDCANFNQWLGRPGIDTLELDVTVTGYDNTHDELPTNNTFIVMFIYENYEYSGTYEDNQFWFTAKE